MEARTRSHRARRSRVTEQSANMGEQAVEDSKLSGKIRISRSARHAIGNTATTRGHSVSRKSRLPRGARALRSEMVSDESVEHSGTAYVSSVFHETGGRVVLGHRPPGGQRESAIAQTKTRGPMVTECWKRGASKLEGRTIHPRSMSTLVTAKRRRESDASSVLARISPNWFLS